LADPLFWLALSFLLVVVSLTAVLMVAIPAFRELGRAARSAEKLFDTLGRELPPTLEAIRLTGLEITELTDDVTEGVQSAGQVVQQVNQTLATAQTGAQRLNTGTKSFLAGARAAWQAWTEESPAPPRHQSQALNPGLTDLPQTAVARPRVSSRSRDSLGPEARPQPEGEANLGDFTSDRPQLGKTTRPLAPDPELVRANPAESPDLAPIYPAIADGD
jgi:uncharacterized phage infection (PIP) family protein YhgE